MNQDENRPLPGDPVADPVAVDPSLAQAWEGPRSLGGGLGNGYRRWWNAAGRGWRRRDPLLTTESPS
ncbi:MAG: hypothetical protein AVDCRST_MAG17-1588 [uncultured Solirubrobacterales bacterium]|uniref:Uncharacterized protein n=1 Tax=uncultured Solirubrobacterales bacterium TaxID=768556 RepID=A0A6J4SSP6_9ACTN|nr:MAG: hypothetical protein AVDCRST_MAG17-1588 [uncultured Solirubrobacterales bacterium]